MGFFGGLHAVLRGMLFVLTHRVARRYAVVPVLVFFVITAAVAFGSVSLVTSLIREHLSVSTWSAFGARALEIIAVLLAVVASAFVGAALAPIVSAPALEKIVELQELELGAAPRVPVGFWSELSIGLKAQIAAFAVIGPIFVLLWLASLLIPGAVAITLPMKVVLVVMAVAWNLLDYPLTLHGLGNRDRLRWMRRHFRAVLGYGVGVALMFAIPFGALIALPGAVAGATRLVVGLGAGGQTSG